MAIIEDRKKRDVPVLYRHDKGQVTPRQQSLFIPTPTKEKAQCHSLTFLKKCSISMRPFHRLTRTRIAKPCAIISAKYCRDHDRDRVHINDIKKCIKWYNFMYSSGILLEAKKEAAAQKAANCLVEILYKWRRRKQTLKRKLKPRKLLQSRKLPKQQKKLLTNNSVASDVQRKKSRCGVAGVQRS